MGLPEPDWQWCYILENTIIKLYKAEEIYWSQRRHFLALTKGASNTSFFHTLVNGHKRRTCIPRLITDDGEISFASDHANHIYVFCIELIGIEKTRRAGLVPDFQETGRRVSEQDNSDIMLVFLRKKLTPLVHL